MPPDPSSFLRDVVSLANDQGNSCVVIAWTSRDGSTSPQQRKKIKTSVSASDRRSVEEHKKFMLYMYNLILRRLMEHGLESALIHEELSELLALFRKSLQRMQDDELLASTTTQNKAV
jgi:hypothetical protein